jgi:uncharacterized protein (TIGR03435 family)
MRALLLSLAFFCLAEGQTPVSFEAAAIHPNPSGTEGSLVDLEPTGRLTVKNSTLKALIRAAYGVQNDQIIDGPKWLDTDRYDIEAKTSGPISQDREQPLMQNLLADRFKFKVHRDSRELTVYLLELGRNGPQFKKNLSGSSSIHTNRGPGKTQITVTGIGMQQFAGMLAKEMGRGVIDKTGLSDNYDFSLEWDPDQTAGSSVPSVFAALQDQMGLRLQSQKAKVDVLVIDSAEKASEN